MEIRNENTAVGNVISFPSDPYSPENLLMYHTALALVEHLVCRGALTPSDYRKAVAVLSEKYGFPRGSIFAEVA